MDNTSWGLVDLLKRYFWKGFVDWKYYTSVDYYEGILSLRLSQAYEMFILPID